MSKHTKVNRDLNHREITTAFEALGCTVVDLAMVGDNCPDILVGIPTANSRVNLLIEIKSVNGNLTSGQMEFIRTWQGQVGVVRTILDVKSIVEYYKRVKIEMVPTLK
jgi:Holliday junction resolvase